MHGLGASSHLTARFVPPVFAAPIFGPTLGGVCAYCYECHVLVLSLFPLAGVWVRDTIE